MGNSGGMNLRKFCRIALHIVFPNRCGFCDNVIEYDKALCDECLKTADFVSEKRLCDWSNPLFVSVAPFYYGRGADRAVIDLKFNTKLSRANKLGRFMCDALISSNLYQSVEVIIPVPLHLVDYGRRGYNQSELLAQESAKRLSCPILKGCLKKTRRTQKQHELSGEERINNLKEAFVVNDASRVAGKTVLLIDDVLTTGATASACAKALKKAGAADVIVLTATKTRYGEHDCGDGDC